MVEARLGQRIAETLMGAPMTARRSQVGDRWNLRLTCCFGLHLFRRRGPQTRGLNLCLRRRPRLSA